MNISGIRPTEGFYTYNTNRINEQRDLQISVQKAASSVEEAVQQQKNTMESPQPEQKVTAYDYAQNYEPDATYELTGADSDIHSLDMEKAISDTQKDQLFKQYQFFVGNSGQVISQMENPVMSRPAENFNL